MKTLLCVVLLLLPATGLAQYVVASHIQVSGDRVTLADLVPEAPVSWHKVALGPAPRPGGERVLDRDWVLQRARQVRADANLHLAGDVVLQRAGRVLSRDEVVTAVEQALVGRLHAEEQYRIDSVGLPRPVAAGEVELQAQLPAGKIPSPTTIWVDVMHNGKRVDRAWVRLEIHRGQPVLVLTRDLRRGDIIGSADVEVRSAGNGRGGFVDPSQVVGKQLVRRLREGTVLSARDLKAVPLVERGDLVRLVARVGGVLASTLGTTLETGGAGDLIRVENNQSGRLLTGVLREGGVVEITTGYGR